MRTVVAVLVALLALSAVPVSAAEPSLVTPETKAKVFETDKYGNKGDQAYVIKGDKVIETDRYGNKRDPAYVVKGEKVYEADRYGNKRDQAYVVKDKSPVPPKK